MTEELKAQILRAMTPMEGWCTPEKALAMADLIMDRKPELVVELGVFGGKSLIPLALACRAAGKGTVLGIDPWSVQAALEGTQTPDHIQWWSKTVPLKTIEELCSDAIDVNNLKDYCFLIKTASDSVANLFSAKTIEFFHLDANHSEEVSTRHVLTWTPKIARDGILIMDDVDWTTQRKAVSLIYQSGFIRIGGDGKTASDDKWTIFENKVAVKLSRKRKDSLDNKILAGGSENEHPDYNRPTKVSAQ